ncbi:unnamed protein product [Rhizophagus irregularis]|nr:unnamed protein product [Rhizophagus irregularis]
MENQNYIVLSENEGSSDEIAEITPIPSRRGCPAKSSKTFGKQKMASTSEKSDQESLTAFESTSQISNDSNPFKQTTSKIKPQTKVSWVWDYFVKKQNESGEVRAYCQFILENGEKCSKHYKYDGSTGNLSYHAIKHGITPPTESITSENKSMPTQSTMSNINGQKEKELSTLRWILLTTQPLSTVTNKAYIEHMHIIDPIFTVPGAKKIRMMIARSYGYNRDKLKLLLKTAQSISLTTDLWSSRSKHGYLGLTATWINKDFEIMDVLLEISYFPTPHTAQAITEVIKKAIQKWEIESQVISIIADNGANIVVEDLVSRVKQLINFFSTQKQIERLINIQKDIGYEETYHLIQDISTRWNSSYLAWDRLIFLQYAVLQLNINLSCSLKPEEKADGNRLKKLVLKDNEWELLDELCNILAPFEKATRDFSGSTYITLSQMFPIITNLTNSLKPVDNLHEEYEEPDDNTIISDTEENLTNQSTGIDYNNISEVLKNIQYDQLKREMQQQISTSPSPTITPISTISADTSRSSTPSTRSLHEYREMREKSIRKVFQTTEKSTASSTIADEITTYFLLPVARENKNPLNWWKTKKENFPILSIIAQKYLGIPATSVASERLFSDAGNHITAKRSLLDPGLVGKMVFLKCNMQTMDHINVFPPDLEVENNDFVEDEDVLE